MSDQAFETEEAFRRKCYDGYIAPLSQARQSSYEQFDRAILTLSSSGLALSLGLVQSLKLQPACSLYFSWLAFTISIILTVISLFLAPKAIDQMIEFAEKYYIRCEEEFADKEGSFTLAVKTLNFISMISFSLAVVATVAFIIKIL